MAQADEIPIYFDLEINLNNQDLEINQIDALGNYIFNQITCKLMSTMSYSHISVHSTQSRCHALDITVQSTQVLFVITC